MSEDGERSVYDVISDGVKDTVHIRMSQGREITSTQDHRFRVLTEDFQVMWRRAADLKRGDWVVATETPYTPSNNQLPNGLAYFLGVFTGDGSLSLSRGDRVNFQTSIPSRSVVESPGHVREIERAYRNFLGGGTVQPAGRGMYHIRRINREFAAHLIEHGFFADESMTDKAIPSFVLESSRADLVEYLAGLFDTDGHVRKGERSISVTTKSFRLMRDVSAVLAALGIRFRVQHQHMKGTVPGKLKDGTVKQYPVDKTYYTIHVSGASMVRLADRGLHLRVTHKRERFDECVESLREGVGGQNVRTLIPFSRQVVRDMETVRTRTI